MQITAKYASTCPKCGAAIVLGSQVEWERDKKAVHVTCPERARPSISVRLIQGGAAPSTGMDSKPAPLFPVANVADRAPEENVKLLESVAHVVEVKGVYALVHASPMGVARIAQELALPVFQSKRGGEYYAVRIAKGANLGLVPPPVARSADILGQPDGPEPERGSQAALEPGVVRMEIKGQNYVVRETRVKRTNIDVRRFEVRKDSGDVITEPYVVSLQDAEARSSACSCPDWIYRRRVCKHQAAIIAHFVKRRQETLPLQVAN